MIDNFKELTLESDVFEDARNKFNVVMQRLFKSMVEAKSDAGSLTLKIDVEMMTETIPNTDENLGGEERETRVPSFAYKVSSQVAVKNEDKGNNNPQMELVWDADKMAFVLQYIANTAQRTIFDADFREASEEPEEEADDSNMIEGEGRFLIEGKEVH